MHYLKRGLLPLALLFASLGAQAADKDLDKLIPQDANGSPARLVPKGWTVVTQVEGHFVGDDKTDMAMVLQAPATQASGRRVLVIAERNNTDYWVRREAESDVLDQQASTQVKMTVQKGVLLLEQTGGTPEARTTLLLRFREEKEGLRLIGRDITEFDKAGKVTTRISVNYLAGVEETTEGGKTNRSKLKAGKKYMTNTSADMEWSNMQ
jgi:hypothetical protein